ncbi:MAG: prepilin-type N-terminal cleavage/methylation domain-containing protein [Kiritimatiellia bacterium]|nr:prepilin-type N-terminal cleavage/methylation domain-containing protein [Kiritimatiellia bacterium]
MKSGITKNKEPGTFFNGSTGFTMLELMIAVGLFSLVIAGSLGVYIMCQRMWRATLLSMDTSRMASLAIQRMVYGVGTNGGLRAAASISVDTNWHNSGSSNYWDTTTNSPPAANDAVNDLVSGSSDDSWRLTYSNAFDGVKYIDYIKQQRSIVFWQNTNQPASRVSVCNYVINSTVSVLPNLEGITIELTVWKKDGMFVSSNQVRASVKMRNNF